MVGETVSHYRIVEKIGEGGMGAVYLAEDQKLRRQVALKFLPEDLTRDETRRLRFVQEARAAAAIEHPHIGVVHEVDEIDGRTFIVMEYVRGKSLRATLQEGRLPLRRALDLAIQVADGLAKAHERGVIHRDLKPENLIVSEDGYAKIIDFGLAKLLEPVGDVRENKSEAETQTHVHTGRGQVLGTVAYMSPEQARGDAVDARSDIFSFGIVLYEMLSGRSPFRRGSMAETFSAVLNDEPSPVEIAAGDPDRDLQRVVRKALAKDAGERYQSVRDLAVDLRELRDGAANGERPAPARRPRARWLALAAGCVVVAAAVGWQLHRRASVPPPGIGTTGRPAIAVLYFEDHTGAEEFRWLARGLPQMLVTGLAQTPGLDVISSQRIQQILDEIGKGSLEAVGGSVAADVARRAGAGAVVVGSIFRSGAEIRLDVQVEDIGSGRVLSAESVRGEDVFRLVDQLTDRIRTSLRIADRAGGRPITEVTTGSLEAFEAYSEGLAARRHLRYGDAVRHLERAVALDPSFALAWFELSKISDVMAEAELTQEYSGNVLGLLDRLPRRQRLLVEARYSVLLEWDPERAVRLLEQLIATYPDEEEAYALLRSVYARLNRPEAALATIERGVEALPESGSLRNAYGYSLARRGRYVAAVRELEAYARLEPDEPNPQDSLGEISLVAGRPEKAREAYGRALEIAPDFFNAHGGRALAWAMEGRFAEAFAEGRKLEDIVVRQGFPPIRVHFVFALMHTRLGRHRDGERDLRQGVELAATRGNAQSLVALELLSALLALEREDGAEAVASIRRAEAQLPRMRHPVTQASFTLLAHSLAGAVATRSGDLEGARARLDAQKKLYDSRSELHRWLVHALEGEMALAAGDFPAAEGAFAAGRPERKMYFSTASLELSIFANNLPSRDLLARILKARGDLEGAAEAYRALNTPGPDNPWTSIFQPRYVLETARLLDAAGNAEAALPEYRRFLEFWKDADPDLPELREARQFVEG